MTPLDIARRYFDAWNAHDPDGVAATFAEGGTYSDPASGGALQGLAIAAYISGLLEGFPDLSFDIVSSDLAGESLVAAQWIMRGTNSGPMAGNPPTGGTIALPGSDFIEVQDGKIRSVRGYFDQQMLAEQLGLQVMLAPQSAGPLSFGQSTSFQPGRLTKPGAISLTWIDVRSDEEVQEVGERGQQVVAQAATMPGFISFVAATIGRRLFTMTAWEDAESPRQLLQGGAHKEAMSRFFDSDFGAAVMTSVWVLDRINALWVRCTACNRPADSEASDGTCQCGQALPEQPPYW